MPLSSATGKPLIDKSHGHRPGRFSGGLRPRNSPASRLEILVRSHTTHLPSRRRPSNSHRREWKQSTGIKIKTRGWPPGLNVDWAHCALPSPPPSTVQYSSATPYSMYSNQCEHRTRKATAESGKPAVVKLAQIGTIDYSICE